MDGLCSMSNLTFIWLIFLKTFDAVHSLCPSKNILVSRVVADFCGHGLKVWPQQSVWSEAVDIFSKGWSAELRRPYSISLMRLIRSTKSLIYRFDTSRLRLSSNSGSMNPTWSQSLIGLSTNICNLIRVVNGWLLIVRRKVVFIESRGTVVLIIIKK